MMVVMMGPRNALLVPGLDFVEWGIGSIDRADGQFVGWIRWWCDGYVDLDVVYWWMYEWPGRCWERNEKHV